MVWRKTYNFVNGAKEAGIKSLHERGLSPDEYYSSMQKYFNEGFTIHKAYKKNVKVISQIHPNYLVKGPQTLTDGTIGEANYFSIGLVLKQLNLKLLLIWKKWPTSI